MSYSSVMVAIKTFLEADSTLSAYNYTVKMEIGDEENSCRPNSEFVAYLQVPEGEYISVNNEIVSKDPLTASEMTFERYKYTVSLSRKHRGFTDRFEISPGDTVKTVFDFEKEIRNSLDTNWKITANVTDFEYLGQIEFIKEDGDGCHRVEFGIIFEEEVEVTAR